MPRLITNAPKFIENSNDLKTIPVHNSEPGARDWAGKFSAVALYGPTIVPVPLDSEFFWELLRIQHGNQDTPFAVAGLDDAWLGVYRDLGKATEPREPNAEFRMVSYVGRNPDGTLGYEQYEAALEPLESVSLIKVYPAGQGLVSLTDRIQSGVDGLIILAHGDHANGIQTGSQGFIQASDLFEPLKNNVRSLRFLLVFACEQRENFLALLQDLAVHGALHPDFGGVLFWGSPKTAFGQHFIPRLLKELTQMDKPKPFLEAIRLARRAYQENLGQTTFDCVYPIAVAFHPQPNPLPAAHELELERYFWRLSRLPETGFGV